MIAVVGVTAATFVMGLGSANAVPSGTLAIGDSVMAGAKSALLSAGVSKVNATVSRQSYSAPAILRSYGSSAPRNIVVHLGTNGQFPESVCRKLVRTAGASRTVYLLTVSVPRSWQNPNNRAIRACAATFGPSRVQIVDWQAAVAKNRGWLCGDRFHLCGQGARGYANLVRNAIG